MAADTLTHWLQHANIFVIGLIIGWLANLIWRVIKEIWNKRNEK